MLSMLTESCIWDTGITDGCGFYDSILTSFKTRPDIPAKHHLPIKNDWTLNWDSFIKLLCQGQDHISLMLLMYVSAHYGYVETLCCNIMFTCPVLIVWLGLGWKNTWVGSAVLPGSVTCDDRSSCTTTSTTTKTGLWFWFVCYWHSHTFMHYYTDWSPTFFKIFCKEIFCLHIS